VQQLLETLKGNVLYFGLDLRIGYWNIEMAPEDIPKTAFSVPGLGLWEFKRMPFGLRNSGATFQQALEKVLGSALWRTALVYIDDVVTFGKSFDEACHNIINILQRLRQAGLKLNGPKSTFFAKKLKYLGHEISANGIAVLPEKVQAVRDWPTPKSVRDIRTFVGFIGYYRNYIVNFAEKAKPLTDLTGKRAHFVWEQAQEDAFSELKKNLTTAPILAYPRAGLLYVLDVDSSLVAAGAVLAQRDGECERVVAYYSQKYNQTERQYCTTKRELYAIYLAVKHFRVYLLAAKVVIRTDHQALQWIRRLKQVDGVIGRWLLELQNFTLQLEYRPGRYHGNADALSRRPCPQECIHCSKMEKVSDSTQVSPTFDCKWLTPEDVEEMALAVITGEPLLPVSLGELREAQNQDQDVGYVKERVRAGVRPTDYELAASSPERKMLIAHWDRLVLGDQDVLQRTNFDGRGRTVTPQIVIPKSCVKRVMQLEHNRGHFGIARVMSALKRFCYWPGMHSDVRGWITSCPVCLARKGPDVRANKIYPPVQFGAPLECVLMDATVISPMSPNGYKYALSVVDSFSRYAWCFPLRQLSARTVAESLFSIFVTFGCPRVVKTDEDTVNRATLMRYFCKMFQVQRPGKIVYDPQSRGQVEVFHYGLQNYLAKATHFCQDPRWERFVPLYMMAYRSTPHSVTKVSPFEAMFGRVMQTPVDVVAYEEVQHLQSTSPMEFVVSLREQAKILHEVLRERSLPPLHTESPLSYPVSRIPVFQEGEPVWYKRPIKVRDRKKLDCPWQRAVVVKRLHQSMVTYLIRLRSGKVVYAHVKWLGPRRPEPG
jgi:hypothetical protein